MHGSKFACEYKPHGKPIMKQKQTFSLVPDIDVENTYSFNAKLTLLMNTAYKTASEFHEHIFRSSRSQMFFKIVALKNFAIF